MCLVPRRGAALRIAILAVLGLLVLGVSTVLARRPSLGARTFAVGEAPDAIVLDPDGRHAFIGSTASGTVSLLDLAHAQVRRTVRVGPPSAQVPLALALDPATQRVFVGVHGDLYTPGVVRVLDSRSGTLITTVRVGYAATALAVDRPRGHLLVADGVAGRVSLLDARSGAVLRSTAVGLLPTALAVDARTARAFVIGLIAPLGATVTAWEYNGGAPALLSVLDTRSGALVRQTPLGIGAGALAVDEQTARVFVANFTAGTVSVLEAHGGTLLRTVTLGGQPTALAVDARRRRVYVVAADADTLSLLDAASGRLLCTVRLAATPGPYAALPTVLAVDAARDRVYVSRWGPLDAVADALALRGHGTLTVLDARTGAVRQQRAVGVAPQAIAVEARSGRVVVVNGGGVVERAPGWWASAARQLGAWLPGLARLAPALPATARVPGSVSVLEVGT